MPTSIVINQATIAMSALWLLLLWLLVG